MTGRRQITMVFLVGRRCAAVLVLALVACSANGGGSSGASPGASGGGTIAIGIDLPLSGADASDGRPTANGAILAIEQANAHGFAHGAYTLKAELLDDAVQGKHDPAAGAQNVKTFIADPSVLAMVGPFNSNVAKSEIPLTNDAGLAQIAPSTVSDGLTVGPDAAALREAHPDVNAFFRVCTRDSRQGAALAAFARKQGWKKIYVIDDDETYGKDLADVFAAQARRLGVQIVGRDHLVANQQDFKALLTKARALGPEAVFFGGTTSTGGGLVRRQMGDVGLGSVPFLGGDGISDQSFIDVRARWRTTPTTLSPRLTRRSCPRRARSSPPTGNASAKRSDRTVPTRTPQRRSRSRRSGRRSRRAAGHCRRAQRCCTPSR